MPRQVMPLCASLGPRPRSSLDAVTSHSFAHLKQLARDVAPIVELFQHEPQRASVFTFDAAGIHADFSRQCVSHDLLKALCEAAHQVGIPQKIASLFAGDIMNVTEGRPALHTALRADPHSSPEAAWAHDELERALLCAERLRADATVDAIVNIGIGGSHLGPAMVTRALRQFHDGPLVRFVSNVDGADFEAAVHDLNPLTTVFIVSSKTMTTSETLHNAERAQQWLTVAGVEWNTRFYAATAAPQVAISKGFLPDNCFAFATWVGGRFSVSSVIGLPIMCALGAQGFRDLLRGMSAMDNHVRSSDVENNLAVVHALMWFAHCALHDMDSVAVVPYSSDMALLPAFLQQLFMESNGKGVQVDGEPSHAGSGPVVWGTSGTDGQHAYFQYLHQGVSRIPVEFISSVAPMSRDTEAHDVLIANLLAQSEALAVGAAHSDPHRSFPGNRPSSVIFIESVNAQSLGALLALYEHSAAVQGWMLGVNSFDQFGVELGKTLARNIEGHIRGESAVSSETLTHPLLEWFLAQKKK